jgi:hypothetical protein
VVIGKKMQRPKWGVEYRCNLLYGNRKRGAVIGDIEKTEDLKTGGEINVKERGMAIFDHPLSVVVVLAYGQWGSGPPR